MAHIMNLESKTCSQPSLVHIPSHSEKKRDIKKEKKKKRAKSEQVDRSEGEEINNEQSKLNMKTGSIDIISELSD
jgi:hypothetical protein